MKTQHTIFINFRDNKTLGVQTFCRIRTRALLNRSHELNKLDEAGDTQSNYPAG